MLKIAVAVLFAGLAWGQNGEIERTMMASQEAWNRGDLAAFASYYEDSPQTTFMGKEVTRGGVAAILDRYRRGYSTREKMGALTFSELEVRPLGAGYALMIGKFALKRTAEGGGDASGRFTLIWKKRAAGWKIIHDHTS